MNAEDIRNVTFDKVMRGYRPDEVDAYLDQVAAELERLQTMRRKKCTSLRKRWTSTAMMKKR